MRTVQDILSVKPRPSNFIRSDALVIDALNMLNAVNLSYLIVMDDHTFKGIFSEHEYARNLVLKGRSSSTTKVADVMTSDLPKVSLNDTVEHCMNEMTTKRTRYLLAYNGSHFEGVITIHDLLRLVIASKEAVFDNELTQKLIDSDESGRIY
ncbi:MAG: CBS domain-containing protein [Bacteroidetes bacterium]|nr:MAG: CBS domain-containing protein [Bacteroidota bacterium]